MDRLACVDVPAFPLQLLLIKEPELVGHPVVVVDEDKPLGLVVWCNEAAREQGVLSGMRYAAALSLVRGLRAGVIGEREIDEGVKKLSERLARFSPDVEESAGDPGVFWLNASGLDPLFPTLRTWAESVRADLHSAGFFSTVVVGFSRFCTWAVARARPGYGIFTSPGDERRMAGKVPLDRLGLPPKERDALARLAVHDVNDLARLPPGALRRRFGKEVHKVHRLARGDLEEPITPTRTEAPVSETLLFDFAISDTEQLLFFLKARIDRMLKILAERQQALSGLSLRFVLERDLAGERVVREEIVRTATPTLDGPQLMNLVHLRLSSLELKTGVVELHLSAEAQRATLEQVHLFEQLALLQKKRRDLEAGARALARVRARFGDDAVVKAKLTSGHLPEASFRFEPIARLSLPDVKETLETGPARPRRLVRRVFEKPQPLPPRPRHEPDGWMLRGLEHGPVVRVHGPHRVSGGWWGTRRASDRDYCFAETQSGAVLWVYYDRRRRRWFLQGIVE